MSEGSARLGLPLVHHLVEQRLRGSAPSVPRQMPARQRDAVALPGGGCGAEFAKASAHSPGEDQGDLTQYAAETPFVEVGVQAAKPFQDGLVAGAERRPVWSLADRRSDVLMDRKRSEHPLGGQSLGAAGPGAGPANDRGQHLVRRVRITRVHSERAPQGKRDQHPAIRVGHDGSRLREAVGIEPAGQIRGWAHSAFSRPNRARSAGRKPCCDLSQRMCWMSMES